MKQDVGQHISKLFNSKKSSFKVWEDFVEFMFCASTNDSKTVEVMKQYEEEWDTFCSAVVSFLDELKETQEDVFGRVYSELCSKSEGQCMTPSDVAKSVASLSISDSKALDTYNKNGHIKIGDPTGCGSGSMLLATAEHLVNIGIPKGAVFIFGTEKDDLLAKAAFVQLSNLGYHVEIACADAITLRTDWVAKTEGFESQLSNFSTQN